MSGITVETAKVYRVGRRRYLSRRGALLALANGLMAKRCDCEPESGYEFDASPYICKYHGYEYRPIITRRLVRFISARLRRVERESRSVSSEG